MKGGKPTFLKSENSLKSEFEGVPPSSHSYVLYIGTFFYPILEKLSKKLRNCGLNTVEIQKIETGEVTKLPVYCDNRVCNNPGCQDHRAYKFLREHKTQINAIEFSIKKGHRKPRAYVFTDGRYPYPISREYCQNRLKECYKLLLKRSKTHFSIHMEIKLHENEWYLHFHVVSGFIELKGINEKWGAVVRYEVAKNFRNVSGYVGKYASKTPKFPSECAFMEYANTTYKLHMHRFSVKKSKKPKNRDNILLNMDSFNGKNTYGRNLRYLQDYVNDPWGCDNDK
jgi:hypothetical protein